MIKSNINPGSRGCHLCQEGKWLCVFLTYQCNAGCHFCPAPFNDDRIYSVFGNNKERILNYLKLTDFEGISFSGGDPFMVFDRLLEWLVYFRNHLPDYYFWVYTNGLEGNRDKLKKLALNGMNEIRFNIAATGYLNPEIWEKIKIAREYFSFVSIEIPSIKSDFPFLEKALSMMNETGIDFLNLHDYILTPGDIMQPEEISGNFNLNMSVNLKFALSSIQNTNDIIALSGERKHGFSINHCSMQQKENQMEQRRKKMAAMFSDREYDVILDDGTVCNYYKLPDGFLKSNFNEIRNSPGLLANYASRLIKAHDVDDCFKTGSFILKVVYMPKMEIDLDKRIIHFQLIEK